MMPVPTLVDTDIIIDSGRGVVEAINCLNNIKATSSLAICVITQMELIVGCKNKGELRTLEKFLQKFQVVSLDTAASTKAVEFLRQYRLSHGLLVADGLIAATAINRNLPFISKNQKHYKFIKEFNLLPYPWTSTRSI